MLPPPSEFNLNGNFFPMTVTSSQTNLLCLVNVKLSRGLIYETPQHEDVLGSVGTVPLPCRFKPGGNSPTV